MKSLRGTVVLRWEYLPGSLFYFVWTQNRADYANAGHAQPAAGHGRPADRARRQHLHVQGLLPLEHVRFRFPERGHGFVSPGIFGIIMMDKE